MAIDIYLSITALDPEHRGALADKLEEATQGKVKCTGGGTGFGPHAESDIDFTADVVGPEEIMKLATFLWQAVGPLTGGTVKVFRVSVSTGEEN
jgi:hypothetical protein